MVKFYAEKINCQINWMEKTKKRFPIIEWLPVYNFTKLFHDVLAGFTVALTEVPQSLAYASIAGLDLQYGLYSGYMGMFIYFFMGSCKDINVGPTGILSLLIQPYVEKLGFDGAILLTLISGIIIFAMGILHLGFIVEFFSYPVIAGFTTAAALQTGSAQLKSLFGIRGKSSEFLQSWIDVLKDITHVQTGDTLLGCGTLLFLLVIKFVCSKGTPKTDPDKTRTENIISFTLWMISLTRYAVAVIFGTVLSYVLFKNEITPFKITGNVEKGIPGFSVPDFNINNKNVTYTFPDILSTYGTSTFFVPMISILEHISIAKAFAEGKTIDGTQEMLALGVANIASSFVKSMPITGSFTRTAVNNQSGVKTTFSGFITGCLVLMSLGFMTSFFYYIPKCVLASVVTAAMISLIEYKAVPILWRCKRIDIVPFLVTLLTSLFWNLEYGIIVGIVVNLFFVLYRSARPNIKIESKTIEGTEVYVVEPKTNLQFPSAEYLKESVLEECDLRTAHIIVLDGKNIEFIDATVAKNLKALIDNLKNRNQTVIFWNFKSKVVKVCVSLDNSMKQYFFDGSLNEIIKGSQSKKPYLQNV